VEKPQTFRSPTALVVWVVWVLFAVGNWVDLAVQGRDHASVLAATILLLATGAAYVTALRPRVIVDDAGVTIKNPVRDHRIAWAAVTDVDLMDLLRVHCTLPLQGQPIQGQPIQGQGERKKVISAWAVHYSRRRQYSADVKARRNAARAAGGGRPSMLGGRPSMLGGFQSMSYGAPAASSRAASTHDSSSEADAKMIVRLLNERATAARAEALWAASPPSPANPVGTPDPVGTAAPADVTPSATVTTDAPATDSTKLLTSTWSNSAIAALVIPALILLIVILL
jgi:Bacterial PH domain